MYLAATTPLGFCHFPHAFFEDLDSLSDNTFDLKASELNLALKQLLPPTQSGYHLRSIET